MRTAVLLSGHLRTWNLCKDISVDSLHEIYGNDIDWFVVLWKTSTATEEEVRDFLLSKNANLKSIKFIEVGMNKFRENINYSNGNSLWQVNDSISGLSYLRQLASRDKRVYEFQNDVIYDRVVYTRPDIIYLYNKEGIDIENTFLDDTKHFNMQIRGDFQERAYELVSPSTHDLLPTAGSLSSDLYGFLHVDLNDIFGNDRKIRLRGGETHAHVSLFLNRHLISLDQRAQHNDYVVRIWPVAIRPSSDIERFRREYKNWGDEYISSGEHDEFWMQRDRFDEKAEMCEKMNIDKRDYNF